MYAEYIGRAEPDVLRQRQEGRVGHDRNCLRSGGKRKEGQDHEQRGANTLARPTARRCQHLRAAFHADQRRKHTQQHHGKRGSHARRTVRLQNHVK